jgi:thioredoxin-related protein
MKGTLLILVSILASSCNHPDSAKKFPASIENEINYDTASIQANRRSTLDELLGQAIKDDKNLFLVFGFEKCGWCKVFRLYHQDPAVKEILSRHFIVTEIDYDTTTALQSIWFYRFSELGYIGSNR